MGAFSFGNDDRTADAAPTCGRRSVRIRAGSGARACPRERGDGFSRKRNSVTAGAPLAGAFSFGFDDRTAEAAPCSGSFAASRKLRCFPPVLSPGYRENSRTPCCPRLALSRFGISEKVVGATVAMAEPVCYNTDKRIAAGDFVPGGLRKSADDRLCGMKPARVRIPEERNVQKNKKKNGRLLFFPETRRVACRPG